MTFDLWECPLCGCLRLISFLRVHDLIVCTECGAQVIQG